MNYNVGYKLSLYKELTVINESDKSKIELVQNIVDNKIYVKKTLSNYKIEVFKELQNIDNIGIPKVYEVIEDEGILYVIEEFINGKTLEEIQGEGVLSEDKVIEYSIKICEILEVLHNLNSPIIHRDIKPSNIIVDNNGIVKLIDFDVSRIHKSDENRDTQILGTEGYASPEQFGFNQTDSRSDIYSIGVLMNVLTTGKLPRDKKNDVDYIILQPIVETGWEDAIHAAKEAGIPVIVADRKIAVDETEYVSWIGSDFEEEGRKAVTWLDQYLTEQGRENETIHIVLLEGTEGATAAIGRTNGILHGVEEHPNWTIVDRGCANFTQGEGQTYMENLLSEGTVKDIDVIISENDNMIFGAMKALDRNGKSYGPEGDIIMISFDALHESFENMMAGKLHATVECNPLLASTVETVIEELEAGREVDKIYNTEENIYTYENAADYIDQRKY